MTTIAYNHKDKEIAVDGRETCAGQIVSDIANKVITSNGIGYVSCGDTFQIKQLIHNLENDVISNCDLNAELFFFDKGVAYRAGQEAGDKPFKSEMTCNRATGTGGDFAWAAMDFGKTAKQAVEYAKTRDIYTGGKVRVIKVK